MTTRNYSTPISHTTDEEFRLWGSELSNNLQSAGLVKTGDTGQIDWINVLKPLRNVVGGYEIFRFNDGLQATSPLFLKLEYGTENTSSEAYPSLFLTVGTSTDGAGNITGLKSSRSQMTNTSTSTSGAISKPLDSFTTFICVKDGYAGLLFKRGAAYGSEPDAIAFFAIGRAVNDDGSESGEGVYVITRNSGSGASGYAELQYLNFAAQTVTPKNRYFAFIPAGMNNSLVNGQPQVFKCYVMAPRMRPVMQVAHVFSSEYPAATTFQATVMGATPRTYLSCGTGASYAGSVGMIDHTLAFLWE